MKKNHAFCALICALVLVLAGAGTLTAGDGCCEIGKTGQCGPCVPSSTQAAAQAESKVQPAGLRVAAASATSAQTVAVRVMLADGSQKVVELPISLFTGAKSGKTCVPGSCNGASGVSAQKTSAKLTGGGCEGPCVPGAQCEGKKCEPCPKGAICEGKKCEPCPPGACGKVKGASTSDTPSDI
ncbi:MAG: hypothetical protein GY867_06615 [bacterium]|nr:hypothetical protein [bacterium]